MSTRVGSITFGTDREGNMNDRSEEEESTWRECEVFVRSEGIEIISLHQGR